MHRTGVCMFSINNKYIFIFIFFAGKYTSYSTGELHVRDVDEHDARRTYQCVIYPRGRPLGASSLSGSFGPFATSNGEYGRKFDAATNELHYGHLHAAMFPIESTFAQIILSGKLSLSS